MLVGEPDTVVKLRVLHVGEREPVTFSVARAPVLIQTVRGFSRNASSQWDYRIHADDRIGYIRVSNFRQTTAREFDRALNRLPAGKLRGLIIDLRFNPGGIMQQAVELIDRFLSDGVIVSTVTRRRAVEEFRAHEADTINDVPLVVLINGSSASAAEIVAGALQARGRATVVGERSFGKGSVQHLIKLTGHEAAVKLTTAYYRLPDGRIIHRTTKNAGSDAWGIIPDIEVPLSDDEARAVQESRRTLDLAFVDSDGDETAIPEEPATAVEDKAFNERVRPPVIEGLLIDRQLERAIEVIQEKLEAAGAAPKK